MRRLMSPTSFQLVLGILASNISWMHKSSKYTFFQRLVHRFPNPDSMVEELEQVIKDVQSRNCQCYEDWAAINVTKEEFEKILMLDGCFIIELLRKSATEVPMQEGDSTLFSSNVMVIAVLHDLLLLENQIPWLVLELLYDRTSGNGSKPLAEIATEFFIRHYLGLSSEVGSSILELYKHTIPSATRLKESGVKFKRVESRRILDVRFKNGVLEILTLAIHNTSEAIFRNLISFEQCCPFYAPRVACYSRLLDGLAGPMNSARSHSTSGRRRWQDAVDLTCDVTPVMGMGHTQSISPQGSIHTTALSHKERQKGRGPNKPKKAARRPNERPFIHLWHKGTFLDVEVPRLIMTLWKRLYDGDYFTYELFPKHKRVQLWELFKDTYVVECSATHGSESASWPPQDNKAWAVAVGGCHSNFMPGIRSQVNLEELRFTYRKRPLTGNSYMSLMISDLAEKQARDSKAMQQMREEIRQVKQQRESMQRMLEDMGGCMMLYCSNSLLLLPMGCAPLMLPHH
ncbi:hypothetical protein SLEP1_g39747 [Rubroshorea leprosula]|uniref:Uncharacterized protein n=1 Tax=Rubroshorea leprosula TaxID=152421 RepID=A0AAV5L172_9ROSI|nr:hypothetical protein SLEP1_g39747 [Rubroshorea leprosula]